MKQASILELILSFYATHEPGLTVNTQASPSTYHMTQHHKNAYSYTIIDCYSSLL